MPLFHPKIGELGFRAKWLDLAGVEVYLADVPGVSPQAAQRAVFNFFNSRAELSAGAHLWIDADTFTSLAMTWLKDQGWCIVSPEVVQRSELYRKIQEITHALPLSQPR